MKPKTRESSIHNNHHKPILSPKEPTNHFHGNLKTLGKNSTRKTSYSSRKHTLAFFKPQKNLDSKQSRLGKNSTFATGIAFFRCFSKSIFSPFGKMKK